MRRAIAATVVGGLVLGGAVATPSVAAARVGAKGAGKAAPATSRADGRSTADNMSTAGSRPDTGTKTVVFAGYEFQVPASWPVYRLDEHPETCVRYDVHAVYLGTPGKDMRCAAGLVGRTQTLSFIPAQGGATGPGAPNSGGFTAPAEEGGSELQQLPAVHAPITRNAVQHKLLVELGTGTPGATVLGTYGADPGVVQQALDTLHPAPAGTAATAQSSSAPAQPGGLTLGTSRPAGLSPAPAPSSTVPASKPPAGNASAGTASTYTSWRGVPANWPVQIVQPGPPPRQPSPQPVPVHPVGGFDTCTAPQASTMRAWRIDYSAVGAYIGGVNAACAPGNLSAGWVKSVAAMGWGTLPLYVGPQAPCWGGTGVSINPGSAAAEGKAAASDAVSAAHALGLAAGSPIYYDMEAYRGSSSCTNAVLEFLGAWNRQVNAAGYVTGMYSSQDSGVSDVQKATAGKMAGFTPPNSVWVALWDDLPSFSGGNVAWSPADTDKQYAGNVSATVGGITMEIDKDLVGGPVAHLSSQALRRR